MKKIPLELFLIAWILLIYLISCQSNYKPLENATFPCMVISEDTANWKYPAMKVLDANNKSFHFISVEYCKKYDVNDTIYKSLNKQ